MGASWPEFGPPRAGAMANSNSFRPVRRAPERSGARDYRILFEKNLAGVYRTSLEGRILDCNDAFARIFGCNTRSEALAMTAQDLYPSAAAREASVRRLRAQGWLANAEECLRRRDGQPVWILVNETLVPTAAGKAPVILGTLIDITERKRAEERLRRERDFSTAVVDTAGLLVIVCDKDGRVLRMSRGAVAATGFSEEEVRGQFCWEVFLPEEDRERTQQWFAAFGTLTAPATPLRAEERCRTRDHGERWIAWNISCLRDAAGGVEFVIATGIDVTEQRMLENQLRQAQKMDAIGQLAGGIAHDFNNLLTVITGHCEILLEPGAAASQPPEARVAKIKSAADRAVMLTRQLLAFSRSQVLTPRELDLNAAVHSVCDLLRPLLGEQVQLRTLLHPAAGRVNADPVQVEQVIMNLAINARDAMPEGGTITLETANTEVDEAYRRARPMVAAGGYVVLAVSDTGQGMDAATRGRIFEPFFTTKARGRGTGLGLATVYGIVKQSNGFIWVYSEPGRGTTFQIYLPRVAEPAQEAAPTAEPAGIGSGETILVVDDDRDLRGLVRELLVRHGYRVVEAEGSRAAAVARRQRFDLLLTDLLLSETTGTELAERLRRIQPGLRVVYASGYTRAAAEACGLLPPGEAFLGKPFTVRALAASLGEAVRVPAPMAT